MRPHGESVCSLGILSTGLMDKMWIYSGESPTKSIWTEETKPGKVQSEEKALGRFINVRVSEEKF